MRFCFCETSRFIPSFTDPKGCIIHKKKYREKAYQLSDTTVDMLKLGWITRGWLRVRLLNSSLEEKTSYCLIGLPFKLNHSCKFFWKWDRKMPGNTNNDLDSSFGLNQTRHVFFWINHKFTCFHAFLMEWLSKGHKLSSFSAITRYIFSETLILFLRCLLL